MANGENKQCESIIYLNITRQEDKNGWNGNRTERNLRV